MRVRVARVVTMGLLLSAAALGCARGTTEGTTADAAETRTGAPNEAGAAGNVGVVQISAPDEAMQSLAATHSPADWKPLLQPAVVVSGTDRLKNAAALGSQAANGLLAAYVGDDDRARALAESVRRQAEAMSLNTAEIERLVATATTHFEEPEAATRRRLVREDIAAVQSAIQRSFDNIGNGAESTMMVFGAWVEGVRITSGVLKDKYDPDASQVLNRRAEAESFLASFGAEPSGASPLYAQLLPRLATLRDAMVADRDHRLSPAAVGAIASTSTELSNLLRN